MAITAMFGFEAQEVTADAVSLSGTAAYSTTTKRTGAAAMRCNPASGASGYFQSTLAVSNRDFAHFAINIATLPSVDRIVAGQQAADRVHLELKSTGAIEVVQNTTVIGTSSTTLTTGTWYWIGYRQLTGTSVVFLQINGTNEVTGTVTIATTSTVVGFFGTEASAVDAYFDDVIFDGAGFISNGKVDTALPISVSATGTGWVGGGGGAAAATAVDNTPPVGVADTGTDTSQIRNATNAANSDMDFNLETYTTLGIVAADTILAVQPVVMTAAPVTTSAKQGTIGVSANPVIAQVALAAGGTAGAFWSGVAGGTFPTGWKFSPGTLTTSPSVTLGSSPVCRIRQVTGSTRIAMVCFMAMNVAWTPGAVVAAVPKSSPYPQLLAH